MYEGIKEGKFMLCKFVFIFFDIVFGIGLFWFSRVRVFVRFIFIRGSVFLGGYLYKILFIILVGIYY